MYNVYILHFLLIRTEFYVVFYRIFQLVLIFKRKFVLFNSKLYYCFMLQPVSLKFHLRNTTNIVIG